MEKYTPVEAAVDFGVPASRCELKCFLSMVEYCRTFCKNVATVAAPLTNLLSPKVPFAWSQSCQMASEEP